MWKVICKVAAVAVTLFVSLGVPLASMARLDSGDDFDDACRGATILGVLGAVAVVLASAPHLSRVPWYGRLAVVAVAVVVGSAIAGGLIHRHEEQVRIRSEMAD